jgi:hypothetical protein
MSLNTAEAELVKTSSTIHFKTDFIFKKLPASPVVTICGAKKYGGKTCNFSILNTGKCSQNHVPSSAGVRYQMRARIVDDMFASSNASYAVDFYDQCEHLFGMSAEEFKQLPKKQQREIMAELVEDEVKELDAPVFAGKFSIKGHKLQINELCFGSEDESSQVPSQYSSQFTVPSQEKKVQDDSGSETS